MKQFILTVAISFGIIYLLLYVFQRQLIYFPNKQKPQLEQHQATDMQLVTLTTEDKLSLTSWYKPALKNKPTILFMHGNAGNIGMRMPLARTFINAGFGLLLLEYRGYGGNEGKPTEQGLYQDAAAALDYLFEQGIKPDKIALFGESLGTAVAVDLAQNNRVCALVLQSPFSSLTSVARYHYPWVLIPPKDKYNAITRMSNIHSPALIIYSTTDEVIPYYESVKMFQQANEPKKLVGFENLRHNSFWSSPEFTQEIINFLNLHCTK